MALRLARRRMRDRPRGPAPAASPASGPAAETTFSPKLAPGLTAAGGTLALLGALGTWIRATEVRTDGAFPEEVARVMGLTEPAGWALAALAAVVVVGATTWRLLGLVPKVGVVVASLGVAGLAAWWLVRLDERAAAMAADAATRPEFVSYSATFGWGAWLLLVASCALALGVAAGLLRELDLRGARR